MLTLANISSQQAKNYYQQENCSHPAVAQHFSEWWGRGSERLQLWEPIQNLVAYENLIDGFSPDRQKRLRQKHYPSRAGYDLTFSAPKSISLAALVGEQSVIEQAHRQAVRKVMASIEDHYVLTRINGQRTKTDNLIVAMWHHDSSRELDPHLHTHCVVINATQGKDGKWRALTNEAFYYHKMRLGQQYRQELAFACQQLGYSIEPHPKGLFEIKGYTREQLEIFSKRHQQILDKLTSIGEAATTENKIWAWHQTRAKKQQTMGRTEKVEQWQAEAAFHQIEHPLPKPVRISEPFSELHPLLTQGETEETITPQEPIHRITEIPEMTTRAMRIAQDYVALSPESRKQTLIVAGPHEERLTITGEIRQALKAEGSLGKTQMIAQLKAKNLSLVQASLPHCYEIGDVVIPARYYNKQGLHKSQCYSVTAIASNYLQLSDLQGNSFTANPMKFRKSVYTQHPIEVSVGDRLRWTRDDQTLGYRNGQIFTLTAIEGNTAYIEDDKGKTKSIQLDTLLHLDYALVSAIDSSATKNTETVLIAADNQTLNQKNFYLLISRTKTAFHFYVQDQAKFLENVQARCGKETPFHFVKATAPSPSQEQTRQQPQPTETPISPHELWQEYSAETSAHSAVDLTKQVAIRAFRDGYSQDTVLQILAHDPHLDRVRQQQGEEKASRYCRQMLRSAHNQVLAHPSRQQEQRHKQQEHDLTL